jgi:amino acid transporter
MQISTKGKVLSVFALMMINVIAVDSLRTLPISAVYGSSLIFYYLLAGLCFFLPTILVTAELATHWPNTGGVYVWVREAFGPRWGFLTIWLQWIYNVVWYPTILAFLAATLAQLINPALAANKIYTLSIILILFWGATWMNCLGIRFSSWVSIIGAVVGTIIPMLLIIGLGIIWLWQGHPSQLVFNSASLLPDLNNLSNLGFLTAVLFGLVGMEMSAVHAGDVKNPKKDYPRALLYAGIIIMLTLVGGSLAIALVIPAKQISLVSSLMEAFTIFFKAYHLSWMIPVIAGAMVSTWVIGPTRGMWVAACEGNMPRYFAKLNKKNMPARILIMQGIIATLLCTVFLYMPSINAAYWILTALTAQLALIFYLFFFAAAIRLRPHLRMWIVAGTGMLFTTGVIILGFVPPPDLHITSVKIYESILIGGVIVFSLPPLLLRKYIRHTPQNS